MTENDLRELMPQLAAYHGRFYGFFCRSEGRKLSMKYLQGLMMPIKRKNVENIAEEVDAPPRKLQEFFSDSPWVENSNMKTAGLAKWGERVTSKFHLFLEVAKQLFGWYILHPGRFSVLYGSLATLAIFLLWIYYTAAIFLFGGEIASLLEQGKSIPADKTRNP